MKTIETLTATINSMAAEISELKSLLLKEGKDKEKIAARLNGLSKIALPKKVEMQSVKSCSVDDKAAPTPKERGNNGAKRKELNIEEEIITVTPNIDGFDIDKARINARAARTGVRRITPQAQNKNHNLLVNMKNSLYICIKDVRNIKKQYFFGGV